MAYEKKVATSDPEGSPSWRQRFGTLKSLKPLLVMIWNVSPPLVMFSILTRLVRALVPMATLYVGKLLIDAVVHSTRDRVRSVLCLRLF